MILTSDIRQIGKFQKTHALKGELNMITELDPEYFIEGNPLIVESDGINVPYFVESIRPKGTSSHLVKLQGINSEQEASKFVNKDIYILKKDAEDWIDELEEENDLTGYKIIDNQNGNEIGIIEGEINISDNYLFIVKTLKEEEILIPDNDDFIIEIDPETQIIKMELPDGLLDLNA